MSRILLRLYPAAHRAVWGPAMEETLDRAEREHAVRSRVRWLRFCWREGWSLFAGAIRERVWTFRLAGRSSGRVQARRFLSLIAGCRPELRQASRRLFRNPGFTVASVLTLGLSIGATTSVFTLVRRVLLNPLPYPEPGRLVEVDHGATGLDMAAGLGTTDGLHRLYERRARSFESVAIYWTLDQTLSTGGDPERVHVARASRSLSAVMGVSPETGRWFDEVDAVPGAAPVAVISRGLWRRRFGSDPGVVGRLITLEDVRVEVIGVMPPGFSYPDARVEAWLPAQFDPSRVRVHGFNFYSVGRLRPGISPADAGAELDGLIADLEAEYPGDADARSLVREARILAHVQPLRSAIVGDVRPTLWILLGSVAVVLAVACANVANLFLVQAESRVREVAVRRALGSDRLGLARVFLTESLLVSVIGGLLGLALALVGVRLLAVYGPEDLPRLQEVRVDGVVLAFTALIVAMTTGMFGALPLLQGDGRLGIGLAEGGRSGSASRARLRTRHLLMGGQVALALVLLTDSGLMIRSFRNLMRIDPGYEAGEALTFRIGLPARRFPDRPAAVDAHRQLLEGLRSLPGATHASAVNCLPLSGFGYCHGNMIEAEGHPAAPGSVPKVVAFRTVADGYFESLRLRLLRGRALEPADFAQSPAVVVVNEALAEAYFPGEDPVGGRIGGQALGGTDDVPRWLTVVGVVANTPTNALDESPAPKLYLPMRPDLDVGPDVAVMSFVVRTTGPPLGLLADVRRVVSGFDPGLAISDVATLDGTLAEAGAGMAFAMVLLTLAASIALFLGLVGIYGVITWIVSRRATEIGVRLALGARPEDIRWMVLRQGGAVTVVGLGVGVLAAVGSSSLIRALLFGVSPWDLRTHAVVVAFLLGNALLACWLPARRAARLPPGRALHAD